MTEATRTRGFGVFKHVMPSPSVISFYRRVGHRVIVYTREDDESLYYHLIFNWPFPRDEKLIEKLVAKVEEILGILGPSVRFYHEVSAVKASDKDRNFLGVMLTIGRNDRQVQQVVPFFTPDQEREFIIRLAKLLSSMLVMDELFETVRKKRARLDKEG